MDANHFTTGDRIAAVINGRRRWLTIVGVGLSPEYVYGIRAGQLVPDKRRFGIFWMDRRTLASAFQMEGGFNDVAMRIARDASTAGVVAAVDRILEPYGGHGAMPRALQLSAWTLDNELRQLRTFGFIVPLIFFSVAAFILNIALARTLALQRQQIAALKALGYSNGELAWHYVKFALVISGTGAVAGVAAGAWLGSGMITLYNEFFRFPELEYHLSRGVAVASVLVSLAAAAAGAQSAVRRAVRIPPAEAMQPESPVRYHVSMLERLLAARASASVRMVLRNLERAPMRSLASVTGISLAVAVLVVGFAFIDVMNVLVNEQFDLIMRQDATVLLVEPRSSRAISDITHLPGVVDVEPLRSVPARVRNGPRSRTVAISGVPVVPRLRLIFDRQGRPVSMPGDGLMLSRTLADLMGVAPGDLLRVEVLEGDRPVIDVPVRKIVDDTLGLQAYMEADELHRLLHEGDVVNGAALTLDASQVRHFYQHVKATPAIADVGMRDVALQNFRETMAQSMNLSILFNVLFAAVIAFGVVYNAARVSLSERTRELASLRVLGFTRAEISVILLGELAILTLCALPGGVAIGYGLGELIMTAFNNEVYRLSFSVSRATVAWSFLVVIAAAILSGLAVRRRIDTLDLVAVLKTRE